MSPEIHRAAAVGFARAADAYERGRPDFPPAAIAYLRDVLDLRAGRTVLDLGAGTGKMSRLLGGSGADLIAVEPVAAMHALLRAGIPGAHVAHATAERLPLRDSIADAAVAAQAFHWFDGPRALAELDRVLVHPARLALVWNVRDESTPWVAELTRILEPHRGDTPSHRSERWRAAFDDGRSPWTPPERRSFPYAHRTSRDATVDRVLSISFVAALDEETRSAVADRVRAALPPGEEVVFPYRTDVWVSERP
jgi:SAM-dependent methyltransferase